MIILLLHWNINSSTEIHGSKGKRDSRRDIHRDTHICVGSNISYKVFL